MGLVLFLAVYVQTFFRFLRNALVTRDLLSFFAPLFLVYIFFINLSFSLLMETEVFVWVIMIVLIFATSTAGLKTAEAAMADV
jgi:hypothetical protein